MVLILVASQKDGYRLSSSMGGWLTTSVDMFVKGLSFCLLMGTHAILIYMEVSKFCRANDIFLYCLPPHNSLVTQPLDVGFFKPLKASWVKACNKFKVDHPGSFVDKKVFAKVFKHVWIDTVIMPAIVKAFHCSEICRFNPKAYTPRKVGPFCTLRNLGSKVLCCFVFWCY